jgi:hypothetical protein
MESEQVASRQVPDVHTPLVQSLLDAQVAPVAQVLAGAQLPPQSVEGSVPFFTPSEQLGTWQTELVHTELTQSPATEQATPFEHLRVGAQVPPQSTPVSFWFFAPSVQEAAVHWPDVHSVLTQSVPAEQVFVAAHRLQPVVPPQSMSLSPPFFTPSLQAGVVQIPPLQTPLTQSVPSTQNLPGTQSAQLPPQSTSVSVPFFTASVQPAA